MSSSNSSDGVEGQVVDALFFVKAEMEASSSSDDHSQGGNGSFILKTVEASLMLHQL
jgi:hypothetical protein